MSLEVLSEILRTEVLTEDTQQKISTAVAGIVEEAKQQAEQAALTQLAAQYTSDRTALVESVDQSVTAIATARLKEFSDRLAAFRDLEAEAATRIVEAKEQLVVESKQDLVSLVRKIDSFLDVAVQGEFTELREQLNEAQQFAWGRKLFEGFKQEFEQMYLHETGVAKRVDVLSQQLKTVQAENKTLQESLARTTRDQTLTSILQPLQGRARQVMETILTTVPTNRLQETYNQFVGRVLTENVEEPQAPATLKEGATPEKETQVLADKTPNKGAIVTGDLPERKRTVVTESAPRMSDEDRRRLLASAGLV